VVAVSASPSSPRQEQILREAAQLFARRGFHGVSIVELGAAVGISGPALYRHFPSKEALLARMLIGISEQLLSGGKELAARIGAPRELLAALVRFQLDFSLREPELITVQDRDLANLPAEDRRRVRALQRAYVEIWVDALVRLHPNLAAEAARVAAHGVFGLLNSTPHSVPAAGDDRQRAAELLRGMALAALSSVGSACASERDRAQCVGQPGQCGAEQLER
jgi:AcrR family transcriptional regulator